MKGHLFLNKLNHATSKFPNYQKDNERKDFD